MEPDDLAPLDHVTDAVNAVRSALSNINLDLPMVVAQGIALFAAIALLCFMLWGIKTSSGKAAAWFRVLISIGSAAIVAAVGYNWWDYLQTPLRSQLLGNLQSADAAAMSVQLIDYDGDVVSDGAADIDSETGDFLINYRPAFADPPRLQISANGCETQVHRPSRGHLRHGEIIAIRFHCKPSN